MKRLQEMAVFFMDYFFNFEHHKKISLNNCKTTL